MNQKKKKTTTIFTEGQNNQIHSNFYGFFCEKSVKKREIHTHQTIFREINYLVTSLVKS